MTRTSKNVLAILLVITMMISLAGTITAIMVLANYSTYGDVPLESHVSEGSSAKVSVFLENKPVDVTGKVTVNLLSVEDGG